ncbi:hypothetical protein Ping_1118 [Psychromonas ingrahamii 37]|uniref:Lipoprotein n=1 Tax=Psychromonas ingrahamii (strain DSM 17664 / CCUG 51855 / 37) TaxID=357804 RepID=A1STZ1_PSYIN|nr:hypothetical protein [Psychromonas ingrahamii]ABM02956.1 hypothetical protein Ping_1118 [Psychromonas ingrahamii 37]
MKKLIILTVAVLSISACSVGPNQIRSAGVDQVFSSQKDAKDVASCVKNKWSAWVNKFDDWGVVNSVEIADGYSVSAQSYGTDPEDGSGKKPNTVNYLADIENKDSGSVTKLYQYFSLNLGDNPFVAAAAECQ